MKISWLILFFIFIGKVYSQAPSIEWQRYIGGSKGQNVWSIQLTHDYGYILSGTTLSNDGDVSGNHDTTYNDSTYTSFDIWVVKLDSSRNIQWQKCLGGTGGEDGYEIRQTSDDGYILVGDASSTNGDLIGNVAGEAFWIVKLDNTGAIQWKKPYGGTGTDRAISVEQIPSGGYYVAGYSSSNNGNVTGNHGGYDYWILKLDTSGDFLWKKCFGGTEWDQCFSMKKTIDGGVIAAGSSNSNDGDVTGNHQTFGQYSDYWIVKINSSGAIQWQKTYGGNYSETALEISITFDHGFIVAGRSNSNDGDVVGMHNPTSYHDDGWIIKIDSIGNLEWQKCLGGSEDDYLEGINQTSDSGFIAIGFTFSTDGDANGNHGNGVTDGWIIKLDKAGNVEWQKCIGGSQTDLFEDVQQTEDGGFVVAGWTESSDGDVIGNHSEQDIWLLKLSASTGITENESDLFFNLYSNPFTSSVTLNFPFCTHTFTLLMIDVLGNILLKEKLPPKTIQKELDTREITSGIYFITIQLGSVRVTKKLIKI